MNGFYSCYSLLTDKHIESLILRFQHTILSKSNFLLSFGGLRGPQGFQGYLPPNSLSGSLYCSLQATEDSQKLRASGDSTKMMLEVVAEAWVKKNKQKMFFLTKIYKTLIQANKISQNLYSSLTTASVCRTGT